jgi:hypothetical protein
MIAQLRLEPRGRESGSLTADQANRYRAVPMTKCSMTTGLGTMGPTSTE